MFLCGNYLMGGDGECHDCIVFGWKQPNKMLM